MDREIHSASAPVLWANTFPIRELYNASDDFLGWGVCEDGGVVRGPFADTEEAERAAQYVGQGDNPLATFVERPRRRR